MLEQQFHHFPLPPVGCNEEWISPMRALLIHLRPSFQQQFHHFPMPKPSSKVQRSPAILNYSIHIRTIV